MNKQVLIQNVVKRHIIRLATRDAIRESKKYKTANAHHIRNEITPDVLELLGNHLYSKTAFIKDITNLYENTKNSLKHIYEEIQKKPSLWEKLKENLDLDPKNIANALSDLVPNLKSKLGEWLEDVLGEIPFVNIVFKLSKLEYAKTLEWLEKLYEKLPENIKKNLDALKEKALSVKKFIEGIWDMLKEKIKQTDNRAINTAIYLVYLGISQKIDKNTFVKEKNNLISGLTGKIDSDKILDDLTNEKLAEFVMALLEDYIDIEDVVKYKSIPLQLYFLYQEGYLDEELNILKGLKK
jgi:hypothetical protein